jgi:carboxylate-amine ligase
VAAGHRGEVDVAASVGVEEEFLLVDRCSGLPVPAAAEVLAAAAGGGPPVLKPELQRSQVESATGVCRTLAEVREQLAAGRERLAAAAAGRGLAVLPTGHPPRSAGPPGLMAGERFERIGATYQAVVRDYQTCGCHVHVGVPDRSVAVAVLGHLRPWLPTLLALSANSPFDAGTDTGYGSWRTVLQSRFPGYGVAPECGSVAEYDRALDALVACGVLVDRQMGFWLARPSEHLPTVEIRVADTALTADDAVLLAALVRALVTTSVDDVTAGRPAPPAPAPVLTAALWTAARHGLSGPAVDLYPSNPRQSDVHQGDAGRGDPWRPELVPAGDLLRRLVEHVGPALDAAGDTAEVTTQLDRLRREGTGADRQRAAARGDVARLVTWLAGQTT